MLFDNPDALWLLPLLPVMLMALAWWGWERKKEIAGTLALDSTPLRRKQLEKYVTAAVLAALLVIAMALPKVASSSFAPPEKAGEIALLVDVSGSMAARKDVNSPSRLQRVKTMLYELVDHLEELGHPKVSLHGFTNIARSLVPFVGSEDYGYLRESISQLLDIYAVPGQGSVLGQSILDVMGKFTPDGTVKLILLFSDGEPFIGATRGLRDQEKQLIEQAIQKANQTGIAVITVGVGEPEGAKIPVYDAQGQFTGTYAKIEGGDYVSYLEEEQLKDLAARTGGKYLNERNRGDLVPLIRDRLAPAASYSAGKEVRVYQSLAPWVLLAAFPIWILFARRHWLG
jgi:Ca-activated chloride channel family protein